MSIKKTAGLTSALVVLGFTSILTQLIYIREFLTIFNGNELVIGLVFCIWMIATAAGSRIRLKALSNDSVLVVAWIFLLHGVLTLTSLIPLSLADYVLFEPGVSKGLTAAMLICAGLLLPYCLATGFIFNLVRQNISNNHAGYTAAWSFGWESSGSVMAGLLFSIGTLYKSSTGQLIFIILLINLLLFLCIHVIYGKSRVIVSLIVFFIAVGLFYLPFDRMMENMNPQNKNIITSQYTPYGKIHVTKTDNQTNIFENGQLFVSSNNSRMAEESVHFALLQRADPKRVLIASGGIADMAKESDKYTSLDIIEYAEINPWLIQLQLNQLQNRLSRRLKIHMHDARSLISKSFSVYDAIVLVPPDPSTAQINRYFTIEFFYEVQQALKPGGVFEISLNTTANYMSNEEAETNAVLYNTLKPVFDAVIVMQGERNYFLASDSSLYLDISLRSKNSKIINEYVNEYFIDDDLLAQQSLMLLKEINTARYLINHDWQPYAYVSTIKQWLSKSEGHHWVTAPAILIGIVVAVVLLLLRKANLSWHLGVFTSAFAGSASEYILLILFQLYFGFVYRMTGLIIALYMSGLAAGSLIRMRVFSEKRYIILQCMLVILVLLIPSLALLTRALALHGVILQVAICSLIATIAFISGLIYKQASLKAANTSANRLYGIDLAGAASGTLVVSLLLLPLTGLIFTCIIIAAVISAGMLIKRICKSKG